MKLHSTSIQTQLSRSLYRGSLHRGNGHRSTRHAARKPVLAKEDFAKAEEYRPGGTDSPGSTRHPTEEMDIDMVGAPPPTPSATDAVGADKEEKEGKEGKDAS